MLHHHLPVILFSALVVSGCSSIPSKLYTTKETYVPVGEPAPCNTFTYGQHPVVVIEGYENVSEATLEILTNGYVISRQTIPMNSGKVVQGSYIASAPSSGSIVPQGTAPVVINVGALVDLGSVAPGTYDVTLKTNDVVAAVARFAVHLPAGLETERQEIESERARLEAAAGQLKQLNAEIARDRAALDQSNPDMVSAFNASVTHYNQLVQEARTSQYRFNFRVENYNSRLVGQSKLLPYNGPALQP